MGNGPGKEKPPECTREELGNKSRKDSICLISIFKTVYNVAKYHDHPGGANVLLSLGGDIADDVFAEDGIHRDKAITDDNGKRDLTPQTKTLLAPYAVGTLIMEDEASSPAHAPTHF